MAEDKVPDSPQSSGDAVPARASRRARAIVIAYSAAMIALGGFVATLDVVGNPHDGGSAVSLAITAFPGTREAVAAHEGPFGNSREIGGHLIADPALIEDAAQGPLPRIAPDGRTPMKAYGRAFVADGNKPRIAVVVRGLGVGVAATLRALTELPPELTLGFVPFASDLQSQMDKARSAGHEVLLELPMEPFDFPDSDPGPHALLVAASAEENAKRLEWALSRATGYVGVMNFLGGRFMGEENAIEPMLDNIAKRGLLFFDNGASSNSVVITSARHVKAPIVTGTLTLDQLQTQAAIDLKLGELENAARTDGFAIGVASAYPISIARLAEWAANARARGFELVPLSSLAARPGAVPGPGVASSE
jgi:polysaccharide deacetylase 2 family uncharacterized protein YibQ